MAVISVNYCEGNEPDDLGYKSVVIYLRKDEEKIFDSGDFVKDWFQAIKEVLNNHQNEFSIAFSSSVDHFLMDGAPYEEAYVIWDEEGEAQLVFDYPETTQKITLFVKKGERPTFQEHKKYCNS